MGSWATMIALSESFRGMAGADEVFDQLEAMFRSLGATHFLATGVALPGRPIDPLILRYDWKAMRDRPGSLQASEPLIQILLSRGHPLLCPHTAAILQGLDSQLLSALDPPFSIAGVPICGFLPYQAVVIASGPAMSIDESSLTAVGFACNQAFARLFALGSIRPERPGDLSARERRVVALSAAGKTAGEIAGILEISQRTVHAHLQNASEKLAANNKTHTVVEALRYGQITV